MTTLEKAPATLDFMAHPLVLRQSFDGAVMIKLGLTPNFTVNHWPDAYRQFTDETTKVMSEKLHKAGTLIGRKYRAFHPDMTKLTPDDMDELWQTARRYFGDSINQSWGRTPITIPGLTELTRANIRPVRETGMRIYRDYSEQVFNHNLLQQTQKLLIPDVFSETRDILYYSWRIDYGLYRESGDPGAEMRELAAMRK